MKNVVQKIGIWGDSLLKGVIFDEVTGKYRATKKCAVNLFSRIFSTVDIKNNSRFGCTAPKAEANLENPCKRDFQQMQFFWNLVEMTAILTGRKFLQILK